MKIYTFLLFLFFAGNVNCQNTKWLKVDDYKNWLEKKIDSLNYIEGIWEVNYSTYRIDIESGKKTDGGSNSFRIAVIKKSNESFYSRNLFLNQYIEGEPKECCDFEFETTANKNRYIMTGFWSDNRKIMSKEINGDFIVSCTKNYTYFDVITLYTFIKMFPPNVN